MKIIDRYLLRQFLQIFFICFCSLTGLFIVFDAFSNLDEFLRASEKEGQLLSIMASHYGYRSLFFFDRTSGVLALISAMFTITWFQRHNELTALLAAGIPTRRIIVPVVAASIAISLLAATGRELVIPRLSEELSRGPKDLMGDNPNELAPRYDHETDVLFRGQHTLAAEKKITKPSFLLPPTLHGFGYQLVAENAYYHPPRAGRPGGYLLKQVSQPAYLDQEPSVELNGKPLIITPRDADWLADDECFLVSDVTFEQLTGGTNFRQFSSTPQLIRGLRNPSLDFGADVRVAIHARFVQPLLDVTLLFLGLPLVLDREKRNVFVAIGTSLVVICVFMLVVVGAQALGSVYLLDPALAVWLPLGIFVPVAVGLSEPLWA